MSEQLISPRLPNGRFPPGISGNPTGNKSGKPRVLTPYSRESLLAKLEAHDYEPIMEMIAVARDPHTTAYLRFEVAREIASYVYSKQKAVQVKTDHDTVIKIQWDDKDDHGTVNDAMQRAENVAIQAVEDAVMDEIINDEE